MEFQVVLTPSFASNQFETLRAYFASLPKQQISVLLTFSEIEAVLGESLPHSANEYSWWSNRESPQSRTWLEAGFGVSMFSPAGQIEFTRGLHRWPGVAVDSWKFGKLPVDERLRELALGYLQSAKNLCIGLGEIPNSLTWPRAAVVCFCYRHSVELFLKSCILHRAPLDKCDHEISKLWKQYTRIYPNEEFQFWTHYNVSLADIEDLLGGQVDVEDFERKHDQLYRYLSDKHGRSPKGGYMFGPGLWLSAIERFEEDIIRISDSIIKLDSGTEPDVV